MWLRTNWHGSRHSDPGSYSFQLRERGSQALRCPSLAKKPFWIFVRFVSIFTISRISILRKKLWFLELSWKCFVWRLLCNVTKYGASWSIGRYGDDLFFPIFELAYVRTFKLTPYVYLFRHLFSIIWCIDHAWFHYYDFNFLKKQLFIFLDEVVFCSCCDKRLGTRRDMCYSRLNPILLPKDGI